MNIMLNFYRLKYSILEILGYLYISPLIFLKKLNFVIKDRNKNGQCNYTDKEIISLNKKTIIIIDNYVPEYNIHAGARTIFMYMQLYKDMGFSVKFIPDDFIKREPYVSELHKKGIDVLYGKYYKNNLKEWVSTNSEHISFVMLNRPRSIKYLDLFKKYTKAKIIYYGMDMYFIREQNRYSVTKKKEALRASKYYKLIEMKMYNNSDVIFTVSHNEEETIEKLVPKVKVVKIPCFFYKEFIDIQYNFNERKSIVFVGGQIHPPNPDAISWFCSEIFPDIIKQIPDITFYVVGSYSQFFQNKYASNNVKFTGKINDLQLKQLYLSVRMAVIPLRYGAGVKGKTIEAMYYGLPFISTDYGIEGINEIAGFTPVANTAVDFKNTLLKLYNDETKLVSISRQSLEYMKNNFSYENAFSIISKELQQ